MSRRETAERIAGDALKWVDTLPAEAQEEPREQDRFGFVCLPELLCEPAPEQEWLVRDQIPAGGNILVVGPPKCMKTFYAYDLAVAAVTDTPFLARYRVEPVERVSIVIMEGPRYQIGRRLARLCNARGIDPSALEGRLSVSHRPDLRLNDIHAVAELGAVLKEMRAELLIVDAWQYVAAGNSNDADEVTPQLMALSALRDIVPDLTVLLIHHARKQGKDQDDKPERVTDLIRGSGAFGAWYDSGVALSRRDEDSPVSVRVELRDYDPPKPYRFTASYTPDPSGHGALLLEATERTTSQIRADRKAEDVMDDVLEFVAAQPGCSKRAVRDNVTGKNAALDRALELLAERGQVHQEFDERGRATGFHLSETGYRAPRAP